MSIPGCSCWKAGIDSRPDRACVGGMSLQPTPDSHIRRAALTARVQAAASLVLLFPGVAPKEFQHWYWLAFVLVFAAVWVWLSFAVLRRSHAAIVFLFIWSLAPAVYQFWEEPSPRSVLPLIFTYFYLRAAIAMFHESPPGRSAPAPDAEAGKS